MFQLLKPIDFIQKLLPKQEYHKNIRYRFLHYCVILEKGSDVLLYNNLTREFLILSHSEYIEILKSKFTKPDDILNVLVDKFFLVPTENDDFLLSSQILNLLRALNGDNEKTVHNFNILPTTACNAHCFYCYQAGAKIKIMNEKTAQDVAKYIINKSNGNKINICWFGGEPLCNTDAINTICNYLNANGVMFKSSITTNGYLFDEESIVVAKENWHLKHSQITLDGLSDTYLKVKQYSNKDPNAFYRVLNNIELLLKNNIDVDVRLNMDDHNFNELKDLINLLSVELKEYVGLTVYVRPIYENIGYEQIAHTEVSRADITKKFKLLQEQLKNLGINGKGSLQKKYRTRVCQADNESWRLILPDGKLAFCEHFLDNDSYATIYNEGEKPIWSEYCEPEEKCKTCPAYIDCLRNKKCPECQHGCYDYEQIMRIEHIRNGMQSEYRKFIKQQNKNQI